MAKFLIKYVTYRTNNWSCTVDASYQKRAGSVLLPLLHVQAAYKSFVNVCNQLPRRFTMMHGHISLTLLWCSFPEWGSGLFIFSFAFKWSLTSFMNICIYSPIKSPMMQDQKSMTYFWLPFSGWGWDHVSPVFDDKGGQYIRKRQSRTIVNILPFTVGYVDATIKRKTRKAELGIGTNRYSQRWEYPQVDGHRSQFGPSKNSTLRNWLGQEPIRTVSAVQLITAGGLP